MGTLVFSFKPTVKTKKTSTVKKQQDYTITQKKIIGLCCITLEGHYYVVTHLGNLDFTKKSFNAKTKKLYSQQLINKKLLLCINTFAQTKYMKELFLPFAPSIYMQGNIVKHNVSGKLYFDLIKTLDVKTEGSKEQFLFYKQNYDIIHKNFICQMNTL